MRLAIPGGRRASDPGLVAEPGGQQGDDGEQPQQARRGPGDGLVGPLALALDPAVITHLAEGRLDRPALDEPLDDAQRRACQIGAQQRLRLELVLWIAQQYSLD